jgi:hypothetical protein
MHSRIWVTQELVLPSRSQFICGPFAIEASSVLKASIWLNYKSATLPKRLLDCQGRHNAVDLAYIAAVTGALDNGNKLSIPFKGLFRYLLAISTRFKASEPRDQIYAILDLIRLSATASSGYFDLIEPDYTKSVAQVYRVATIFAMIELKSLHIWRNIYHRGVDTLELEGHSSWVPQWYRIFDHQKDVYRLLEIFDASLGREISSPALETLPHSIEEQLPLRGFRVASITEMTDTMTAETLETTESLRKALLSIDNIVVNQHKVGNQNEETVLARILVAGMKHDGFVQLRDSILQGNFKTEEELEEELGEEKFHPESDEVRSSRYHRAVSYWCNNRRFFGTNSRYMGIASSPVRVGDLVTILYGAPWPIILRLVKGTFQFVCQCYVDGIMHGEAVERHQLNKDEDEIFTIV